MSIRRHLLPTKSRRNKPECHFGLRDAPATFQRAMNVVLATVRWQYAFIYTDDTIVISETPGDHLQHNKEMSEPLNKAGVTTELKNVSIVFDIIDYLGLVFDPGGLHVATKTTEAINTLE